MKQQGSVRIIAGEWRGRRVKVPDVKGLRPTPDRVRETLFNWLAPFIRGANCLDLFAGSGVLGFEAVSRGASSVLMVDESAAVVKCLREEAAKLGAENITIDCARVPEQLRTDKRFDIVFLDPPYQSGLLLPCCEFLEKNDFLSESAYIYLEAQTVISDNDLPASWHIIKSARAGQVFYHLANQSAGIARNIE